MTNKPYWPFDVGDMLDEIEGMTGAEAGGYLRLCMAYWLRGEVPRGEEQRRRLARLGPRAWEQSRAVLAAAFVVEGEVWRHPRLDGLRAMVEGVREKRAAASALGVKARAEKRASGGPRAGGYPQSQLKLLISNDPPLPNGSESESESPSGGFYITPPEGVAGDARAREATAPPPPSPHPAASAPPPPNGRARGRRPPAHESDGREPYTDDEMRRIREGLAELKRRKAEAAS